MDTNRIEKSVLLRAPRWRVWEALTDVAEFGEWFGVKLNGSFAPGECLRGRITHRGCENDPFQIKVERVHPERLLSWRWHPNAVNPRGDYSTEPTTIVVFGLEDVPGGTQLTVVESGFDQLPLSRRFEAYKANEKGWAMQMDSIQRHITRAAA
jgi:uncharacterized protein YndB with AHSA1/START domain